MLKVVTMIYAGWINKQIVAGLQALGLNAGTYRRRFELHAFEKDRHIRLIMVL